MIDAKELRIGNWVKLGKHNTQVYQILYSIVTGQSINHIDYKEEYFEPIPLTPELLIDFGFEKESESSGFSNDFVKLWNKPEGGFYHINEEFLTHIDTVHILQNWYYFNVGEELEIKL